MMVWILLEPDPAKDGGRPYDGSVRKLLIEKATDAYQYLLRDKRQVTQVSRVNPSEIRI